MAETMNVIIMANGHDGPSPLQAMPDLASAKALVEGIGARVAEKVRAEGSFDLVVFSIYEPLEDGTLTQTWQFSDWKSDTWEWLKIEKQEQSELAEWRAAQHGGHPAG